MKALLLYRDRDFDLQKPLPQHEPVLRQDLELDTLLQAMAGDDALIFDVAHKVLLAGLQNDVETILYRHEIVRDCLQHPDVVRSLYGLAVEAIERKQKHYWGILSNYPSAVLGGSIEMLQMFMEMLHKLRAVADAQSGQTGQVRQFGSSGFTELFAMLQREFSDAYFARIQEHLAELKFKGGVLISAQLGAGNKDTQHVLRQEPDQRPAWVRRMLDHIPGNGPQSYTFHIAPRDEAGAQALSALRDQGINLVANALAQSMDHILSFFEMLRTELAFYVGCLNLHERLTALGASTCFPQPAPVGTRAEHFAGLYDVCLALSMGQRIVANTVEADGKSLVIVTGANQGGKSSFLRSIGLAQLMLQCGMFVAADSFAAELCVDLYTHYKREEDATMKGGKLDEELARMSTIAETVTPNSMLLFNESFASTNEREGSEIATQIVRALLEQHVKVFFVTHQYEFPHGFFVRHMADALFLRAERLPDGTRTFKLTEGEPLQTSYGEDLYREVFAEEAETTDESGPT